MADICADDRFEKISSKWQTGVPTEEGMYIVAYRPNKYIKTLQYKIGYFLNGIWSSWLFDDTDKFITFAWQKIEPYEVSK